MSIRHLREEELDLWLDFLAIVFGEKGTPRAYFETHWRCDPCKQGVNDIYVSVDDRDEIQSTLRVFHRTVRHDGRPVNAIGIGEVGTKKEARGRGLASALIKRVVKDYYSQVDLIYLHSGPHLYEFYRGLGFQQFRVPRAEILVPLAETSKGIQSDRILAKDLDWESPMAVKEVDRLNTLYQDHTEKCNWSTLRDRKYWMTWIRGDCVLRKRTLSTFETEEGETVGYAIWHWDRNILAISEIICLKGEEMNYAKLLASERVAEDARQTGLEALTLSVHGVGEGFDDGWMAMTRHGPLDGKRSCNISRCDYF